MDFDINDLEKELYAYIDRVKDLLSSDFWNNLLMDSSKNEAFVLILLHRGSEVNMSMIADYLKVPLNTATGIVGRMEKQGAVQRLRSASDKRVVNLVLTDAGRRQIDDMIATAFTYFTKVSARLTAEEIGLTQKIFKTVMEVLEETPEPSKPAKRVRKITIE